MLRNFCLIFLLMIGWVAVSEAQLVKEFKVTEKAGFDMVALEFTSYKSSTQLKRTKSSDPVYIHGHLDQTNILPVFSQKISKNILYEIFLDKSSECVPCSAISPSSITIILSNSNSEKIL